MLKTMPGTARSADWDDEDAQDAAPPSKNELTRAAAREASDLYVNQSMRLAKPRTLAFSIAEAAKTFKVDPNRVKSYLAGAGARALWAVETGDAPPESQNSKRARAAIAQYDRDLVFVRDCTPQQHEELTKTRLAQLAASPFGRVLLGLAERVEAVPCEIGKETAKCSAHI